MSVTKESRGNDRHGFSGTIRLYWESEGGQPRFANAQAQDVSAGGLCVVLTEKIPVRTLVSVESVSLGTRASAQVRRCDQKGVRYRVGLEFTAADAAFDKPRRVL